MWWVYVIQSQQIRVSSAGKVLPGFHYVGCTTNLKRRLRQHNGEIKGGAKYTSKHRPWCPRAAYGPYETRSDAMKAERALKKGKRGTGRVEWTVLDSRWCRGLGAEHPWVTDPLWKPENMG